MEYIDGFQVLDEIMDDQVKNECHQFYEDESSMQKTLEEYRECSIVGMQYVLEVRKSKFEYLDNFFICVLCGMKLNDETLLVHMKSIPHIIQFCEIFIPKLFKKYGNTDRPYSKWSNEEVKDILNELKEFERSGSRGVLAVCYQSDKKDAIDSIRSNIEKDKADQLRVISREHQSRDSPSRRSRRSSNRHEQSDKRSGSPSERNRDKFATERSADSSRKRSPKLTMAEMSVRRMSSSNRNSPRRSSPHRSRGSSPSDRREKFNHIFKFPHIDDVGEFIQRFVGRRGANIEELERKSNCRMTLCGRGNRRQTYENCDEPLHVHIHSTSDVSLKKGIHMIEDYLHEMKAARENERPRRDDSIPRSRERRNEEEIRPPNRDLSDLIDHVVKLPDIADSGFVQAFIGWRGTMVKELETKSDCKISLCGKGYRKPAHAASNCDPEQPLHVHVKSDTNRAVKEGIRVVEEYLDMTFPHLRGGRDPARDDSRPRSSPSRRCTSPARRRSSERLLGPRGERNLNDPAQGEHYRYDFEVNVPPFGDLDFPRLFIGPKGTTITELEESVGCKIMLCGRETKSTFGKNCDINRPLHIHIVSNSESTAHRAIEKVEDVINTMVNRQSVLTSGEKIFFPVKRYPDVDFVSYLKGANGRQIEQIQQETRTTLFIRGKAGSNSDPLHIHIKGHNPLDFKKAAKIIEDLIEEAIRESRSGRRSPERKRSSMPNMGWEEPNRNMNPRDIPQNSPMMFGLNLIDIAKCTVGMTSVDSLLYITKLLKFRNLDLSSDEVATLLKAVSQVSSQYSDMNIPKNIANHGWFNSFQNTLMDDLGPSNPPMMPIMNMTGGNLPFDDLQQNFDQDRRMSGMLNPNQLDMQDNRFNMPMPMASNNKPDWRSGNQNDFPNNQMDSGDNRRASRNSDARNADLRDTHLGGGRNKPQMDDNREDRRRSDSGRDRSSGWSRNEDNSNLDKNKRKWEKSDNSNYGQRNENMYSDRDGNPMSSNQWSEEQASRGHGAREAKKMKSGYPNNQHNETFYDQEGYNTWSSENMPNDNNQFDRNIKKEYESNTMNSKGNFRGRESKFEKGRKDESRDQNSRRDRGRDNPHGREEDSSFRNNQYGRNREAENSFREDQNNYHKRDEDNFSFISEFRNNPNGSAMDNNYFYQDEQSHEPSRGKNNWNDSRGKGRGESNLHGRGGRNDRVAFGRSEDEEDSFKGSGNNVRGRGKGRNQRDSHKFDTINPEFDSRYNFTPNDGDYNYQSNQNQELQMDNQNFGNNQNDSGGNYYQGGRNNQGWGNNQGYEHYNQQNTQNYAWGQQ